MKYEGLDQIVVAPTGAEPFAPFERLGLCLTPPETFAGSAVESRSFAGGGRTNLFTVRLARASSTPADGAGWLARLLQPPGEPTNAARALVLRVLNLAESLRELALRGVSAVAEEVFDEQGEKLADVAVLPDQPDAVVRLALVEWVRALADRYDGLAGCGLLAHSLALKRLDHLAAAAPDLESTTRFWQDVLDIPVWGEVVTPTTVIRQMKVGDAIIELLGPAGPDSPLHTRPPGLSSMTAFEVPDLDTAVTAARAHGFNISAPATGALPGTLVSRIPAEELSGLALQLLQYV